MMQMNFNEVPNAPTTRLVLAPPPIGSVTSTQVAELIRQIPEQGFFQHQVDYELARIPADKWEMISNFLSTTCRNAIDGPTIKLLSNMPIDRLARVIDCANEKKIMSYHGLLAL